MGPFSISKMSLATLLVCLSVARVNAHENEIVPTLSSLSEHPGLEAWNNILPAFELLNTSSQGNGLPFLPCSSTSKHRMSDGVELTTTIVKPWPCQKKRGTVLIRSPYGPLSKNIALIFAKTHAVVMQDMRGTFSSGGHFDMFRHDGQDGEDMMRWITSQPWSNGDVFTLGISADGIGSITPSVYDNNPVKAQWGIWTTSNGHEFVYPQGAYRIDLLEGYMNLLALPTKGDSFKVIPELRRNEAFGPWWYNLTDVLNVSKPSMPPGNFLKHMHWPMIFSIGWWDIFQGPSFRAVDALWNKRLGDPSVRDKHVVIVDPLGHCAIGNTGGFAPGSHLHRETLKSFAVGAELAMEYFQGDFNGHVRSRIGRFNYYVMTNFGGEAPHAPGNYWTSLDDFPKQVLRNFYMQPGGVLSDSPAISAASVEYTYDPSREAGLTPMLGGNNLPLVGRIHLCGTADQSAREKRDDVVVFDSAVLSEDTPVVGKIRATLFVSSSAVDTDFVATISDLGPKKSMLVRYGAVRMRWRHGGADGNYVQPHAPLTNGTVYEVDIDLWDTAYVFPKGHQVRVAISSAASPYYHANPNDGSLESASIKPSSTKPVPARNAVHIAPSHPSKISLPIVKLEDMPPNPKFRETLPVDDKQVLFVV